jgi:hypothetical protein
MTDDANDDGVEPMLEALAEAKPKARRPGTFAPGNKAAKGSKSGAGKQTKQTGLAVEVRKHKKVIVKGLLDLAINGSASARARALVELARIGWGNPASAAEMGAVDPIGPSKALPDNPGIMDVLSALAAYEPSGSKYEPVTPYVPPVPQAYATPAAPDAPLVPDPLPEPPTPTEAPLETAQAPFVPPSEPTTWRESDRPQAYAEKWWRQPDKWRLP